MFHVKTSINDWKCLSSIITDVNDFLPETGAIDYVITVSELHMELFSLNVL